MMNPMIAPSILASDFLTLGKEIQMINTSEADWIHVDVMDGHFVPNLSFGLPIISQIKKIATKPLDVHLMISNPDQYIDAYGEAGADNLTVHVEVCNHLHRTLQHIHSKGMTAGVALNPHTPIEVIQHVISQIDVICIMSVNPGFGGQQFIEETYEKVKALKAMIRHVDTITRIEIDGGVTLHNAKQLVDVGADILVAGSSVFKSQDPQKTISQLHAITK